MIGRPRADIRSGYIRAFPVKAIEIQHTQTVRIQAQMKAEIQSMYNKSREHMRD
jgi:hypothetical protein